MTACTLLLIPNIGGAIVIALLGGLGMWATNVCSLIFQLLTSTAF